MAAADYTQPLYFEEGMEVFVPVPNLPAAMQVGKPKTSGMKCVVTCAAGDMAHLVNEQHGLSRFYCKWDVLVHVSHPASGVNLSRDTIDRALRETPDPFR